MKQELAKTDQPELSLPEVNSNDKPQLPSFNDSKGFELAQRVAKMLSASNLTPKEYQNNIPNTMIALEMANRVGASPLMVMQNLYIINGRPSWSSTFIIAALNNSKRFTQLRFKKSGEGEEYGYEAYANDINTKELLEGPKIDWKMVKAEGWLAKPGSKWKTMPELMFRYRAAAFFGRLYAPDIMMGMLTADEASDVESESIETISHEEVTAVPDILQEVIKTTDDITKLTEIYKSNPEYHSNPDFMKLLTARKIELNGSSTTNK